MSGIGTRLGIRAAEWLLDAVLTRRLPRWQRVLLAVLLALLFVVPPLAVAAAIAVLAIRQGKPGWLLVSVALIGVTVWFWWEALHKHGRHRR